MDHEAVLLIMAFATYKKQLKLALHSTLPSPKSSEASEKFRKDGNALFMQKDNHDHELHAKLLSLYNKSAAFAMSGSQELAFAYANRSAFLLHLGKYEECIQDIDKVLEITESNELKVKMLCRKVECCKKLGIAAYKDILDKAQSLVDKLDNSGTDKHTLQGWIDKVIKLTVKVAEKIPQTNEAVNLPETDNLLEKVSIKYSKKYGRYLVAEQDYNPGDIIFVEKLFSTSVHTSQRYINCHYCMSTCWSGVPCDHCNWVIFCSQECYQKAWQEYHDIECSVGHLLNKLLNIDWNLHAISIKILIKAMKNAGSVENLKAQLKAVDECTDVCSKGFYKDGTFTNNTIQSFYSLSKVKHSKIDKNTPLVALMVLIGLLRHPQLSNMFVIKKMTDLMHNKDIVFLGSLLMKFSSIRCNNSFSFLHYMRIDDYFYDVPKSSRGSCMASLLSLANNSCCPNANVCVTEDCKVIVYALQPIEKDSQIFISYSKEYHTADMEYRKNELKKYDINCDCQACIESWPPVLLTKCSLYHSEKDKRFDEADAAFMKHCAHIGLAMLQKKNYGRTELEMLTEKITLAFKTLKQPSAFTCLMQDELNMCITDVYNGLKPQFTEECKRCK